MRSRDDGLAALRAGNARDAVRLLQIAVQEQPNDGVAWGALGVAWAILGEHAQGAAALEEAIRLMPRQPSLHYNLGRCREGMGRCAEALDAYREALRLAPDHAPSANAARRLAASLAAERYGTTPAAPGPAPAPVAAPPEPAWGAAPPMALPAAAAPLTSGELASPSPVAGVPPIGVPRAVRRAEPPSLGIALLLLLPIVAVVALLVGRLAGGGPVASGNVARGANQTVRVERLGISVVFPARFGAPERCTEESAGDESVTYAAEASGFGAVSFTVGRLAARALGPIEQELVFATVRDELPRYADARECSISSTRPIQLLDYRGREYRMEILDRRGRRGHCRLQLFLAGARICALVALVDRRGDLDHADVAAFFLSLRIDPDPAGEPPPGSATTQQPLPPDFHVPMSPVPHLPPVPPVAIEPPSALPPPTYGSPSDLARARVEEMRQRTEWMEQRLETMRNRMRESVRPGGPYELPGFGPPGGAEGWPPGGEPPGGGGFPPGGVPPGWGTPGAGGPANALPGRPPDPRGEPVPRPGPPPD